MKRLRFTLRGFRPPREAVRIALGELERKVMEELWRCGTASVQEVYQAFSERSAYTTLMTTLNRLHRKGLLNRRRKSRAFVYSPRVTREEFDRVVAKDVIDGLLGNDAGQGLNYLKCERMLHP
jgi:predicted transcriptional regulator